VHFFYRRRRDVHPGDRLGRRLLACASAQVGRPCTSRNRPAQPKLAAKDGELKGGLLLPAHLDAPAEVLFRHDALMHACAIDVSREDPKGVDAHKAGQCEGITKYLAPTHHPKFVKQVWELRRVLERMPNQLYLQHVLLSELVCEASQDAANYFSQRRPRELTEFEWTIDAKDPCRITAQEKWWRDTLAPLLESRSRRQPMRFVRFDYRFSTSKNK
jgi:hypothetical protein